MGLYTLITLLLISEIIYLLVRLHKSKATQTSVAHQLDETAIILESLHDGLIECDTLLVPIRVNHSAESILGLDASDIIGRSVERGSKSREVDIILEKILFAPKGSAQPGQYQSYDIYIGQNDSKKLRIFTIPKTDSKTKALGGFIKIIRDVSIETVIENHKSDLVSTVSHQLLTPLTGMKWIIKSLLDGDGGPTTAKQVDMLKKGLNAGDSMISLVGDILDVTKIEQANVTYKKELLDLAIFIHEVVMSRAEKSTMRNIHIQEDLASITLLFDKERLSIAVGNLIDNAIDYSPAGTIVKVSLTMAGSEALIQVADKGIGIAPSEVSKLFTKFYRADNAKRVRTSGTGLGLYLSKHIVEDHGGKMAVQSTENGGSTFSISLPLSQNSNFSI